MTKGASSPPIPPPARRVPRYARHSSTSSIRTTSSPLPSQKSKQRAVGLRGCGAVGLWGCWGRTNLITGWLVCLCTGYAISARPSKSGSRALGGSKTSSTLSCSEFVLLLHCRVLLPCLTLHLPHSHLAPPPHPCPGRTFGLHGARIRLEHYNVAVQVHAYLVQGHSAFVCSPRPQRPACAPGRR